MTQRVARRALYRMPERASLLAVVRRAHVSVLLTVLATVSLPLAVMAGAVVMSYARHNLELTGRSVAYTVEAATVFRDGRAAAEDLKQIADREAVAEARIEDAVGRTIAEYRRDVEGPRFPFADVLSDAASRWLWPDPVTVPIVHAGRDVGRVLLRGDATALVDLAMIGTAGVLLSLLLILMAWRTLIARLKRDIVQPLHDLVAVTRSARRHEGGRLRAPAAPIFELNELSESFNDMLEQIEAHQARMRRENESLARQALHDSLTGLPNRAYFHQRLAKAFEAASREDGRLAVMVLDSDNFKSINDAHGHSGGDRVLAEVARRVRAQLRESDVVARVGGDEFVVLLAPLRHVDDALRIADKILASMHHPVALADGSQVVSSVSVGVAVFPDHAASIDALLHAADKAMYRSKKARGEAVRHRDPRHEGGV